MDELDDFVGYGYEELVPELREREDTRKAVIRVADLTEQISNYIIKNHSNSLKSLTRMLETPIPRTSLNTL